METYLAIRKSTRSTRRGAAAASGERRAVLAHEIPAEATSEVVAGLADAGFSAATRHAVEEGTEPTFERLPYVDAVVLRAEHTEPVAEAQDALGDDFIIIPDIPLEVPTPTASSEPVPPAAALDAAEFWPVESGLPVALEGNQRGDGAIVAVLDTGCDADHGEFGGKQIDFVYAPLAPGAVLRSVRGFDTDGHGTHVCGIVGGSNLGLAPGADLLVASVIESETVRTSLRRILDALDWVLQRISQPGNQDRPVVLNMSLGFKKEWIDPPTENAVMIGVRQLLIQLLDDFDVLPVVAIGNDGAGTVRAPGYFPETLSVGAVDVNGVAAGFSGGGPGPAPFDVATTPDVAGFGVEVLSSLQRDVAGTSFYARLDGTSMATPYVSGIAALVAAETGLQGRDLGVHLVQNALALGEPADRVGAGLARFAV